MQPDAEIPLAGADTGMGLEPPLQAEPVPEQVAPSVEPFQPAPIETGAEQQSLVSGQTPEAAPEEPKGPEIEPSKGAMDMLARLLRGEDAHPDQS